MRARPTPAPRRHARGMGLIDGLIAIAVLSFGLLGLTRMQAKTLAMGTEGQSRAVAAQFGSELLNAALIDNTNHDCYTLPEAGACGSAAARAYTTDWKARAEAALPHGAAGVVYTSASGRLTVTLTWTGKSEGDAHRLEATTDVR